MLNRELNRESNRASAADAPRPTRSAVARRALELGLALSLAALGSAVPRDAAALRINSASDSALTGALTQTFDAIPVGYFTSQSFLTGANGFTIATVAGDVHIDDVYCGDFGTSGRCFDTVNSGGTANDDFNVTFTGSGVRAFGFAINALDGDWTVQTFAAGNVLLNTYVINSQSPGLTGNNRRGYFGATESQSIQSVQVRSAAASDRALIDNFAFVPAPEPGTALLVGFGLALLAGSRSRRLA